MKIRTPPHHFAGNWTKEDVSNLEDTLQILFEDLKRLALEVDKGGVGGGGVSLLIGPQGPPGRDGADGESWFPTSGAFSSSGGTGGLTQAQVLARVFLKN